MNPEKPIFAEIKQRGQLTIPKKIRESHHLETGSIVSLIPLGDTVIISPRRLALEDARRELKVILKEAGCTLDELTEGLEEERQTVFEELYGHHDH